MSSLPSSSPQYADDLSPTWVGLTSQEGEARLSEYGPNDPSSTHRGALRFELLHLFLNPLVIILLVASAISAILDQKIEAEIIFVIVTFSATIDFVQTYRSQRAIQRLQEHVSLTATALRDGQWQEIKRQKIVPGDIVRLSAGDLVPADGQLLEARDLYVQQAALTGESMPAEKEVRVGGQVQVQGEEKSPLARNLVFLGTSVVSGTGVVRIAATGPHTAFGSHRGATSRSAGGNGIPARPAAVRFTYHANRLFPRTVHPCGTHRHAQGRIRVLRFCRCSGCRPHAGIPSHDHFRHPGRGAIRMARNHVIVKHLPAIQNFGTIDVFCSDKTGTLTTGEMILESSVDYLGHPSDRPLALAYVNSKFESGIRSPLELAILKNQRPDADAYSKCDEVPFDFERRRLSIVVKEKNAANESAGLLIVKGAPEGILDVSTSYESAGQTASLDTNLRNRCRQTFDDLSSKGFRLLAVAYRDVDPRGRFSAADENSLVLAGYLAFADPPSPDAAASVVAMKRDGVDVKILTGDSELVARHVCEQVGIENPA